MTDYIEPNGNAYPLCPHCDCEVDAAELETEMTDDIIYCYRAGFCPTCGRKYKWTEEYVWNERFYDFKEVRRG